MPASEQVQYESRARMRFAVIAFFAALFLVGSEILQYAGPRSTVTEITLDLITIHKRGGLYITGAVFDTIGLILVGVLLGWLHSITAARKPDLMSVIRWLAVGGAVLGGVMTTAYAVVLSHRASQFVSTGTQGYPEADHLTAAHGLLIILPLLQQIGTLALTIGCIWTSLNAMRVGLVVRPIGYIGIMAGALFLFGLPVITPVVEAVWLGGMAVILAGRWPQGDPPAWAAGVAVPWLASERQQQELADRRAMRGTRGKRGKVSDAEVFAAVDNNDNAASASPAATPSASTGTTKRKRKRKS